MTMSANPISSAPAKDSWWMPTFLKVNTLLSTILAAAFYLFESIA
jgi:hypothetical protein